MSLDKTYFGPKIYGRYLLSANWLPLGLCNQRIILEMDLRHGLLIVAFLDNLLPLFLSLSLSLSLCLSLLSLSLYFSLSLSSPRFFSLLFSSLLFSSLLFSLSLSLSPMHCLNYTSRAPHHPRQKSHP